MKFTGKKMKLQKVKITLSEITQTQKEKICISLQVDIRC